MDPEVLKERIEGIPAGGLLQSVHREINGIEEMGSGVGGRVSHQSCVHSCTGLKQFLT